MFPVLFLETFVSSGMPPRPARPMSFTGMRARIGVLFVLPYVSINSSFSSLEVGLRELQ